MRVIQSVYDEQISEIDAEERGYTTLRGRYGRPNRAEGVLTRLVNGIVKSGGFQWQDGIIATFTCKGKKLRIYTLFISIEVDEIMNPKREYRFFDTFEEAQGYRMLRGIQIPDISKYTSADKTGQMINLGHLRKSSGLTTRSFK